MLANRTRWLLLPHFGTHSDLFSYSLLVRVVLSQGSFINKNEWLPLPVDGKTNHIIRHVVG